MMTSREKEVISFLDKSKNKNILTELISYEGDTLLHYAAGSNLT